LKRVDYHIFHFIGHSDYDAQKEDGVLLLEDEQGKSRTVSGQYLGMLLHDEKTLRLAFLNSCEGGRTARNNPFAGVCQSLLQQGVPAVIAMQFAISDKAAISLVREFYTALAEGSPVDAALAEARKGIFADNNDVEWATPVLYMRAMDGQLFDVGDLPATPPMTSAAGQEPPANSPDMPASSGYAVESKPQARLLWRNPSIIVTVIVLLVTIIGGWRWFVAPNLRGNAAPTLVAISTSAPTSGSAAVELAAMATPAFTAAAMEALSAATSTPPTFETSAAGPSSGPESEAPQFIPAFYHNFENGDLDPWGDGGDGAWQVVDDGTGNHVYQVNAPATGYSASDPPEKETMFTWADYALTLRLRVLQPGSANDDQFDGWFTLRDDLSAPQTCPLYNFFFDIRLQEVALATNEQCDYKLLEEQSYPLELNRWYTVRLEAVGTQLKFLIDDQVVIERDDPTSSQGFYYLNAGSDAILQFDNIQVEQVRP
jgi:hypothetical protein